MYYSNRKRAYRYVRTIKSKNIVVLENKHGCQFRVTSDLLDANGYKTVKHKPRVF